MRNVSKLRLGLLAIAYGAVAGAVAQLTLQGMTALQHLIWQGDSPWWRIALTIGAGGLLLIFLRHWGESAAVEELLAGGDENRSRWQKRVLMTALAAIVAVAFGGAIGPEAGLLAVVAEMSALVGHRIARDAREARILDRAASAAALSGLYASPPGAVAVEDDEIGPGKAFPLLAGIAGLFAFLVCSRVIFGGDGVAVVQLPVGDATWSLALPAVLGGALGYAFRWLHHGAVLAAGKITRPWLVMAAGTVLFAAIASALPLVRFSGHHEISELITLAGDADTGMLIVLSVVKVIVVVLCLVAGWRGGEFFPLAFVGASAGAAVSVLTADAAGPAMAAGMAAAVVVGWGRPLATLLVLVLLVDGPAVLTLMAGVAVGWVLTILLPMPTPASSAEAEEPVIR